MEMDFDYLLEEVNKTVQSASRESLRIGVIRGVRYVVRKVGIKLVCSTKKVDLHIRRNKAKLPSDFMKLIDVTAGRLHRFEDRQHGYQTPRGVNSGQRLDFNEAPTELTFSNMEQGIVQLEYYYMPVDDDENLIIPEVIYNACYKWCQYELLDNSNNPRNPKWQERLIMKADAETAISDARGDINENNPASLRTYRLLK